MDKVPERIVTWRFGKPCGDGRLSAQLCGVLALVVAVLFLSFAVVPRPAVAQDGNYKLVQGTSVYFGILPAGIVRGHSKDYPEATMRST